MLVNLLSLYIASTLNPEFSSELVFDDTSANSIVKLASTSVTEIIDAGSFPFKKPEFISPIIEASSSIAIDLDTGKILYEKNAHERRAIASITKLMTLLIILEENDLSEVVTVSNNAAGVEGSTMFLRSGEQILLENLVYGAIIHSANDSAYAMAEHNAGSIKAFVEKMNTKALELGLVNTHFANPAGLDNPQNYSSAYDVAKLGKYVYEDEFIKKAASIKELKVNSISGNYTHQLTSTNDLLDSYLNIKGLKTGKTDIAGLCLISVAENNSQDEIITVVLGSPARFTETKILVDWVFRAYSW